MALILNRKHWQIFIGLMIPFILYAISACNLLYLDNLSSLKLKTFFALLYLIIFFSWVLIVGLSLNQIKDNPYHFSKIIFIIAVVCSVIAYGKLHLSGLYPQLSETNGLLSLLMAILTPFGIIFTFKSISESLRSIEISEKAKFKEYIIDAILIFALPIGIWFIQPRLNLIYQVNEMDKSEIK